MGVRIEAFLSKPPCPNSTALVALLREIAEEYGEDVQMITREGRTSEFDLYYLTSTPAVVVDELIKMMGFCPSKESLVSALKEVGLESSEKPAQGGDEE